MPRRGRGPGHQQPPGGPGGDGDGQVAGLPGPRRAERASKVVVATATKALQDQLADKDLPLVESGLGLPAALEFAVLEGSQQLHLPPARGRGGRGRYPGRVGRPAVRRRGRTTGGTATVPRALVPTALTAVGTRGPGRRGAEPRRLVADLEQPATAPSCSFEPSDRAWGMVSVGPRECPGAFNCPSGGRCFAESAHDRAAAADIVVVNTHLYGAHLASGGAVLPEHDVVVFDEAHELEEVMTSSLGVEITPGRFRALVTTARALVEPARCRYRSRRSALPAICSVSCCGDRAGRGCCRPRPGATDDRELAELIGRAGDLARRTVDALRRGGAPTLSCRRCRRHERGGGGGGPDRANRKTRSLQAAVHLAEDLHRLEARTADAGGLGRRHPASQSPAPLPHRRGPGARLDAVGRSHRRADQRDHPAAHRAAGGPRRLPRARSSMWGAPSTTAPTRCSTWRATCPIGVRRARRGGHPRGAGPPDRAAGRAHAGLVHQSPGHRRRGPGAGRRLPGALLLQGELPKGRPVAGVRHRRDLVPLCHPRVLAGSRHPRPCPVAGHHRPPPVPAARRPFAPSPARPGRGPGLLSRRSPPGRHAAGPGIGPAGAHGGRTAAWWPSSTPVWPRPRTAGVLLAKIAAHAPGASTSTRSSRSCVGARRSGDPQ